MYCQTSPNKIKSPNLWHVTSILVWCSFGPPLPDLVQRLAENVWVWKDSKEHRSSLVSLIQNSEMFELIWGNLSKSNGKKKPVDPTYKFKFFVVISEVFQKLWLLDPILAHQSTKFEISEWFCFSRHPWGPCGRQNSGMKPKSADSVSVAMI